MNYCSLEEAGDQFKESRKKKTNDYLQVKFPLYI